MEKRTWSPDRAPYFTASIAPHTTAERQEAAKAIQHHTWQRQEFGKLEAVRIVENVRKIAHYYGDTFNFKIP
jgi:hypothetical protein